MNNVPIRRIGVGGLFIVAGVVGLAAQVRLRPIGLAWDALPVALISLVALLDGIFLIMGRNWARWLAIAWLIFHVVISFLNGVTQGFFHLALTLAIGYLLFDAEAQAYFRSRKP